MYKRQAKSILVSCGARLAPFDIGELRELTAYDAVSYTHLILVHERDRKGSIQTTQEVEIYFNFVGRFVPPAFGDVYKRQALKC